MLQQAGDTQVPAQRSRTTGWRRCLEQIHKRHGSIEIAIDTSDGSGSGEDRGTGGDLVFRSKVLDLPGQELWICPPSALGKVINFHRGLRLVGIMAIGQNRWKFTTTCLGETEFVGKGWKGAALRLELPSSVQRCQRRRDYRLDATGLALPDVKIWPLLDPTTVVQPEGVNAARFLDEQDQVDTIAGRTLVEEQALPQVGPSICGHLVNLGGGGVGLTIAPDDTAAIHRTPLFWTRFSLSPHVRTPVCATARLVHSHIQSDKRVYAGMTFDFTYNPSNRSCVVQQIVKAIACQQKRQLAARNAA